MERKKSHYFSYYPIFLLYSPQSPCLPPSNYSQNEMILCLGFASAGEKMEAIDYHKLSVVETGLQGHECS